MDFKLSNSKLHEFENLCPIVFKAKYIDKTLSSEETFPMACGNFFETLCIGSGAGGVAYSFERSINGKKLQDGVYFKRIQEQAENYKVYRDALGGKVYQRQLYVSTEVRDDEGEIIPIEGTLDIVYQLKDGKLMVIDLKMTGDTDNEFGDFSWGRPEKTDMSQVIHYGILLKAEYDLEYFPETQYWVFDRGTELKFKPIRVGVEQEDGRIVISEQARWSHIQRLSEAYHQIMTCIHLDDWPPKNTFDNCKNCKIQDCRFRRIMPEFYDVVL